MDLDNETLARLAAMKVGTEGPWFADDSYRVFARTDDDATLVSSPMEIREHSKADAAVIAEAWRVPELAQMVLALRHRRRILDMQKRAATTARLVDYERLTTHIERVEAASGRWHQRAIDLRQERDRLRGALEVAARLNSSTAHVLKNYGLEDLIQSLEELGNAQEEALGTREEEEQTSTEKEADSADHSSSVDRH